MKWISKLWTKAFGSAAEKAALEAAEKAAAEAAGKFAKETAEIASKKTMDKIGENAAELAAGKGGRKITTGTVVKAGVGGTVAYAVGSEMLSDKKPGLEGFMEDVKEGIPEGVRDTFSGMGIGSVIGAVVMAAAGLMVPGIGGIMAVVLGAVGLFAGQKVYDTIAQKGVSGLMSEEITPAAPAAAEKSAPEASKPVAAAAPDLKDVGATKSYTYTDVGSAPEVTSPGSAIPTMKPGADKQKKNPLQQENTTNIA